MMRRIGTAAALAVLAVLAVTPAATAAAPPPDDTGRSWEVAGMLPFASQGDISALAMMNTGSGAVRQAQFPDYFAFNAAYSPDARTVYGTGYVWDSLGAVFAAHDAATGDILWQVRTDEGQSGRALAVSPDGSVAMTGWAAVDLVTHEVETFSPCGDDSIPYAVAISPDGSTAWHTCSFDDPTPNLELRAYDVDTLAPVETIRIPGHYPGVAQGIEITPDGSTAMISRSYQATGEHTSIPVVLRVDLTTGTYATLELDTRNTISISPDGTHAYVAASNPGSALDTGVDEDPPPDHRGDEAPIPAAVTVALCAIDIATLTVTVSVPLNAVHADPAVSPDGAHVYAATWDLDGPAGARSGISTHETASLARLRDTPVADRSIRTLAITPDQAPIARLTASEPNSPVTFDASASTVEFGTISEYAWDFGDGASTVTTTPTVEHEYAEPGEFTATVRLTSSGGTSTEDVYTGKQLLRNGDASAVATVTVTVPAAVSTKLPPTGFQGAWVAIVGFGMLVAGVTAVTRRRVQHGREGA
ncbi:PKD domain-containing protein [Agromyces intestinalis]|uniref:PKD domain-containing protein n=1 Tax=Agromyces intestinalis TaxID=2592652 RepID=A0A5C1YF99_9MICO|nr:PKD domain-containing protein [Agromyces intestinalis]QEO14744.1 PKD domain-containing protein [Agromyces intestinalis]